MKLRALLAAAALSAINGAGLAQVSVSSSTLNDPHRLVGSVLGLNPDFKKLAVFPEILVFDVSWGILSVGQATLEAPEIVEFNGRPAYHIISRATSNSWCDTFYKVRDVNESWVDAQTLESLGYFKKLREGHFFRDEWTVFNHENQTFLSKRTNRDGSFSYFSGTTTAHVQDILSSMSFLRSQPLAAGGQVVLDVNTRENWPLVVRALKNERVKTPAGRFDAVEVEPALRKEGLFIQKGRKLQIWLTNDAQKRPVLMQVEVFFGHITAKLRKMI